MSECEDIQIRIGLPLPLDVVSTLTVIIGTVYPSARIKTDTGRLGDMVIVVDDAERRRRPNKREIAKAKVLAVESADEADLIGWEDDGPVPPPPADLDPDNWRAFQKWQADTERQIADGDLKPAPELDLPERDVKALTQGAFQRVPRSNR